MAGYLGTKAVLLSTTAANVVGTVTADAGQFNTSLNVDGTVTADGLTVETAQGNISIDNSASSLNFARSGGNYLRATGASGNFTFITGANDFSTSRLKVENNGDISFYEDTGTTPKFFWDASAESLGIGTSSPSFTIESVSATSNNLLRLRSESTSPAGAVSEFRVVTGANTVDLVTGSGDHLIFSPSFTEAMRIDSSGNLLVGKTVSSSATAGVAVFSSGFLATTVTQSTANVGSVAQFRRNTTDGSIVDFYKDGTTVGSIGAVGGSTYVSGSTNGVRFLGARVQPCDTSGSLVDNVMDIGFTTSRFDDIYATNGTIQTSDRNEKQDIEVLSDAETRVAQACKGLLRKFRWQDAVAEKGDDARIHFGIIAQDLRDAFTAEGLDAGRYAMFISSTWWEADRIIPAVEAVAEELDEDGNVIVEAVEAVAEQTVTDTYETQEEAPEGATERTRLGVRYPELLAFIIGAM